MSLENNVTLIDGIQCYSPESAKNYLDYPEEGFEVTDKLENKSFWCRSRSRVLCYLLNRFAKIISKNPVRFLELGCGTGFFLRELSKNKIFELTGSDIYLSGLKYAKKNMPTANFIQLDATQNTLPVAFDMIGAFDVIEHIDDDVSVIQNVHKLLTPQGFFVISVPQYQFLWSQLDVIVKHKRRYSASELTDKLRSNGFKIVYQSSFVTTLFPLMLVSRFFDKKNQQNKMTDKAFAKRVTLPPFLNWLFDKFMYLDEWCIRCKLRLPFGGSLLMVAQKI